MTSEVRIMSNSTVRTAVRNFWSPGCIIKCCYSNVYYVCPMVYDHCSTCIWLTYTKSVNAVVIARHNHPSRSARFVSICQVFVNSCLCGPAPYFKRIREVGDKYMLNRKIRSNKIDIWSTSTTIRTILTSCVVTRYVPSQCWPSRYHIVH